MHAKYSCMAADRGYAGPNEKRNYRRDDDNSVANQRSHSRRGSRCCRFVSLDRRAHHVRDDQTYRRNSFAIAPGMHSRIGLYQKWKWDDIYRWKRLGCAGSRKRSVRRKHRPDSSRHTFMVLTGYSKRGRLHTRCRSIQHDRCMLRRQRSFGYSEPDAVRLCGKRYYF